MSCSEISDDSLMISIKLERVERVMYVSDGVCFEYACVREKVCRYSSVSEENEREGTESSFYEGGLFVGERDQKRFHHLYQ